MQALVAYSYSPSLVEAFQPLRLDKVLEPMGLRIAVAEPEGVEDEQVEHFQLVRLGEKKLKFK